MNFTPQIGTAKELKTIIPSFRTVDLAPVTYRHKFYGREDQLRQAARSLVKNYANRYDSDHKSHTFLLVPGGSGIGKTRFGDELSHISPDFLHTVSEFTDLGGLEQASMIQALENPIYIFIDFNNGERFRKSFDMNNEASVRIGLRVACKYYNLSFGGVAKSDNASAFELSWVLELIIRDRLSERVEGPPVFLFIHLDEYQIYIKAKFMQDPKSMDASRAYFKEMLQEIGTFMRTPPSDLRGKFVLVPVCTGTSAFDITFLSSDYAREMISLPPLTKELALCIVRDAYQESDQWPEASKKSHFLVVLSDTGIYL